MLRSRCNGSMEPVSLLCIALTVCCPMSGAYAQRGGGLHPRPGGYAQAHICVRLTCPPETSPLEM